IFGMRGVAVIALAIVLEDKLPVGLNRVAQAFSELRVFQSLMPHLLADVRGNAIETDRIVAERDEQEPRNIFQRHRMQRKLRLMHTEFALGRSLQPTVEIVGPGVIRADKGARVSLLLAADSRAAMPAGVVEGAEFAVLAAREDDRVMADRPGDPVAGLRDQA